MIANDPRHGTTRGYHAGCHNACCRAAMARYEKEGRLARLRGGRAVPALGAQRRIRALMRLGWTSADIAQAAGWGGRNAVLRIVNGQKGKPTRYLERKTDDTIRRVYAELCMTIPARTPARARTIARAQREGWLPPLAYDDIDTDAAPTTTKADRGDIDEAVVLRVVAGEHLPMTPAERTEVVARLRARGMSYTEIERHTGITKIDRHVKRSAA